MKLLSAYILYEANPTNETMLLIAVVVKGAVLVNITNPTCIIIPFNLIHNSTAEID